MFFPLPNVFFIIYDFTRAYVRKKLAEKLISSSHDHKYRNKFFSKCIFFLLFLHDTNEVEKMTKKVAVAFSIFVTMFGFAWLMHENTKRIYVDTFEKQLIPEQMNTDATISTFVENQVVFERFGPREYIRIMSQ